jgi:hypothetical protein
MAAETARLLYYHLSLDRYIKFVSIALEGSKRSHLFYKFYSVSDSVSLRTTLYKSLVQRRNLDYLAKVST